MKLFYEDKEITHDVSINHCTYESFAENQADSLTIRLNDVKGMWSKWNPQPGDMIRLEHNFINTGRMYIKNIKAENGLFLIRSNSIPYRTLDRENYTWEGVRFSQLGNQAAKKTGLDFISYGCGDEVYPYIVQKNESSLAFFSRLCMLEGCQVVIHDKKLIAYREAYIEAQEITKNITIGKDGVFSYHDNSGKRFRNVELYSGSFKGLAVDVDASQGAGTYHPPFLVPTTSDAEATRFAQGILRNVNKNCRKGIFSKELITDITAASLIKIKNEKASLWDGNAFVTKIHHNFIMNKTMVSFRMIGG